MTLLTKPLPAAPAQAAEQIFTTADIRERSKQAGTFSMQRWNHDDIALADEQASTGDVQDSNIWLIEDNLLGGQALAEDERLALDERH